MNKQISDYIGLYQTQMEKIFSAFEASYLKTGFSGQLINDQNGIEYNLLKDDLSGDYSLQGIWNNRQGMLLFHPDGTFFAEYDVVKPHPQKSQWFVEAITVWGKDSEIKAEPKLIPAV